MICGATGGCYHFYLVFQGTYLSKVLNIVPAASASLYSFWLTCTYIITLPFAGWAADRWGLGLHRQEQEGFLTLGLITLNISMASKGTIYFPLLVLTTVSMVFFVAPGYTFLTRQYEVGVRFRCLSFGHAAGSMLFSGTTPVVCLFLWQATAWPYAPYLYFMALVLMGLGAFIWGNRAATPASTGR